MKSNSPGTRPGCHAEIPCASVALHEADLQHRILQPKHQDRETAMISDLAIVDHFTELQHYNNEIHYIPAGD